MAGLWVGAVTLVAAGRRGRRPPPLLAGGGGGRAAAAADAERGAVDPEGEQRGARGPALHWPSTLTASRCRLPGGSQAPPVSPAAHWAAPLPPRSAPSLSSSGPEIALQRLRRRPSVQLRDILEH
ncbi:hypothetical protein TREES_T100006219 [Tupaia chinensis]|uniref:Uncharacterized protein n=1 Tax=Tupaia chinensis TaxID=246437 RepID=L9LCQ6_TUPCH|nr:hypothetical protein TREES_T100006219 [Tupaia chinensis]